MMMIVAEMAKSDMNISQLVSVIGLGILILNAGIQWGMLLAASAQHKREIERLEKSIESCRNGWSHSAEGISDRFDRIEALISTQNAQIAEMKSMIARLEERSKR